MPDSTPLYFIGLMSGTSLDGADGALVRFDPNSAHPIVSVADAYIPFSVEMRKAWMDLQTSGNDEIHRESLLANQLAEVYAQCVCALLEKAGISAHAVTAIGAHGQTIRHRPELGYTRQSQNPALLAELTGIDVVADFRARDIAAGGQGAPLVTAFHQAAFAHSDKPRVVINIGGISNISILPPTSTSVTVTGFDTGPGNVLMDAWIGLHRDAHYDRDGAWAGSGTISTTLLALLLEEDYFHLPPPKSTGRDLFHLDWLKQKLETCHDLPAADVQATLAEFTAISLANDISRHASEAREVYVCGGGAHNAHLMKRLQAALDDRMPGTAVMSTDALGISPNQVEAIAFAWLAHQFSYRAPSNLPEVTGAKGPRILGALYPR